MSTRYRRVDRRRPSEWGIAPAVVDPCGVLEGPEGLLRRPLSLMLIQAEAEKPLLQNGVRDQVAHRPGMNDCSVVHHGDIVTQSCRGVKVLLHQQNGFTAGLQLAKGVDHVADDGGCQSL